MCIRDSGWPLLSSLPTKTPPRSCTRWPVASGRSAASGTAFHRTPRPSPPRRRTSSGWGAGRPT
eukprot:8501867-Alexandrium_andersonii.AAC.1